jgi:hypothetical protein
MASSIATASLGFQGFPPWTSQMQVMQIFVSAISFHVHFQFDSQFIFKNCKVVPANGLRWGISIKICIVCFFVVCARSHPLSPLAA